MTFSEPQNIFLTGFMGAGKTTVGKCLAQLTGYTFLDLDSMIVNEEQRSIPEIFATDGESYFRNCETNILKDLRKQNTAVYATGGGIVIREENRGLMRGEGRIVYLRASWETLLDRLKDSVDRPLVDSAKDFDALERLWRSRIPFYLDADHIVDTDGITPMQVAQKVVAMLKLDAKL